MRPRSHVRVGLSLLLLNSGSVTARRFGFDPLAGARADVTRCKRHRGAIGVPPTKRALPLVSMAVELAHALGIFEAGSAKVCVSCAVVGSQAAALIALELHEGQAMLGAEILIAQALVSQRAIAAHHLFFMCLHLLLDSFHSAVRISSEKGVVTAIALVVERQRLGHFLFCLLSWCILVLGDHIALHVHDGIRDDVSFQSRDLANLLMELSHVRSAFDVLPARGALEEAEGDAFVGPAGA